MLVIVPCAALADWEPSEVVGLSYPHLARSARIAGLVVVRLTVGADGSVKETEAVSGHPLLAEAARKNAAQWKFKHSGQGRDKARDAYLVYRFVLDGSCAGSDCRTIFVVEYPNLVMVTSEMPPIQVSQGKVR